MSDFFNRHGSMVYDKKKVINIFKSILAINNSATNITIFQKYELSDDEKPEEVAEKLYNNRELKWVLFIINNMVDPINDWLFTFQEVYDVAEQAYDNINDAHHFSRNGRRVPQSEEAALQALFDNNQTLPVDVDVTTNLEFELSLNEGKRNILVLHANYITDFVDQFNEIIE